jgi:diacylglycerol kinase (ATP)
MLGAAIFGLGSSTKDLKPFQKCSDATWRIGLPADSSEADAILIFGGDGTVHRHLAQLVKLGLPVLVVPCGSGNDFARALKLGSIRDSVAAWRKFSSGGGNVRAIDLGVITPLASGAEALTDAEAEIAALKRGATQSQSSSAPAEAVPFPAATTAGGAPAPHGRYFCCVGGVGLDSEVARRANNLPRWLRGHGGYVLSFAPALLRFAPVLMKIMVPGGEQPNAWVTRSAKATVVTAFANAPTYGGGMKIAPNAQLDDGQLDICVVSDMDKFKLFCLFPTIYLGRHLSMPEVQYFQTNRLRLETETPLDVYGDGECVCQTPIEVSTARSALKVVIP